MRLLVVALLVVGCGKKDETKPFIEIEKAYGPALRTLAAWIPLLEREGKTYDLALADHARDKIYELRPGRLPADAEEATSVARVLDLRLGGFRTACMPGLQLYGQKEDATGPAIKKCREAVADVKREVADLAERARAAGTPAESVPSLDKPDPAVKQRVDEIVAAIEPGPAGKAWEAMKNDDSADGKKLDEACKAAAEESEKKLSKLASERAFSRLGTAGMGECLGFKSAQILVDEILSRCGKDGLRPCNDPRTCQLVERNMQFVDRLPKRYAAAVKFAADACKK